MRFGSLRELSLCLITTLGLPTASLLASEVTNNLDPTQFKSIEIYPKSVTLHGADDAAQLIVTGITQDGRSQDLTSAVEYKASDSKLIRINSSGRVIPVADGKTEISVRLGDKTAKLDVLAESLNATLPINFANQIVPIFTKQGCNSGGCHGKASGQNGFKLSLLGFEPDMDLASLIKEGRGRRVMPTSPDQSLLLLKGTGAVAHGGGKKLEPNSDEYKLIRRWIASGMPTGKPSDPVVTKISVFPEHRVMSRQNLQQFAVYAHYSNGQVEDITRRAQYDSNDQEIATVDAEGLVRTLALSGEATIMARYQGHVATFRATVPLGLKTPDVSFVKNTFVDEHTSKKWKELGLVPSDLCTDEQFARRAHLDITGTLPTPEQLKSFLSDKDSKKRDKLVDNLLETPEYSYYFANKWADILRVKRGKDGGSNRASGTYSFHNWIREAIASDKPYDQFVSDILSATGDEEKNPPVVWYKDLKQPEQFVDDTAQVFLGLRIACANCHHHPYEKWSQDDYWSFAAFFGNLGRKQIAIPGRDQNRTIDVLYTRGNGSVTNKRTGKAAPIKPLDGELVSVTSHQDPRRELVNWMIAPQNPFFARAVANRYWAHFFGRGIVDPIDDMRVTNPPSNPELLEALSNYLVTQKYSLKELVRAICKSRTYQLSSIPNEFNKNDKQAYARYYPKRLPAEVLHDAVCQVTNSPASFSGLPADKFAPNRAIMLPDESFTSYFLDVFGRPQRISACECERVSDANLAQALHLLNSDEIQQKLGRAGGRIAELASAKDTRKDEEKIEELFLWTLGRKPTERDMKTAIDHLNKPERLYKQVVEGLFMAKLGRKPTDAEMVIAQKRMNKSEQTKKNSYENILWALLNTKEFIFNW
ncbi:DUF1553 domain-containing protein [Telmatocola sphagniphila]|uniref:DUF1553 domain-containing protein n=1 Tax=Telmatocola sphagniphila TaxID=1123043 RepID=A0A8E6B838_9BACT|nr:DUF1549 domain-containing protein [Telmatocola sphagniphila]QVL33628.1 DUF1553 domain-containing protein [Telmatocola sphagniphila]